MHLSFSNIKRLKNIEHFRFCPLIAQFPVQKVEESAVLFERTMYSNGAEMS